MTGSPPSIVTIPFNRRSRGLCAAVMCGAGDWEFLEQGGRHAVFRYKGTAAEWVGLVIRFLKCTGREEEEDRRECSETLLWLQRVVWAHVKSHVDIPQYTPVSRTVAKAFSELGAVKLSPAADAMPDYTRCDILVEIKPKKGTIFTSHAWCDKGELLRTDPLRKTCCKHCMQQSMKRVKGKISAVSRFCPVHLYQGDRRRAIESMFGQPQNTLLIRENGERVDPTEIPVERRDEIVDRTMAALEETRILGTLLDLQRCIPLDIDVLHTARQRCSKTISYLPLESTTCLASELREQADLPDTLPSSVPSEPSCLPAGNPALVTISTAVAVERYFMSRSAQDASVMVQLFNDGRPTVCRIIDLDRKPKRKYEFWYAQDQTVLSVFRQELASRSQT
ncbi:Inositol-pentakisphosphate 2-kinase [Diplonema papillatum]|nr:Inositol-pentakisphosphate 2-kinase [Diplonema papillatum]KAJ9463927.1 Inositol-pentakisphosphate 2-kinase [Diplonema papillatum]